MPRPPSGSCRARALVVALACSLRAGALPEPSSRKPDWPDSLSLCADCSTKDPEKFSETFTQCLQRLSLKQLLEGAGWTHAREQVTERARSLLVRAIEEHTPVTAEEAPALLALARAPGWEPFRERLMDALAMWPAGREVLARALESEPPGPLRLTEQLAYLRESGVEPCGRPDLAAAAQGLPGVFAFPPQEAVRVTAYADEVRRAFLTPRPLAGASFEHGFAGRTSPLQEIRNECDAWLLHLAELDGSLPDSAEPVRALVEARLLTGDPQDAVQFLVRWNMQDRDARGIQPATGARRVAMLGLRDWIVRLMPSDLEDKENRERLCAFSHVLRDDAGWWSWQLTEDGCPLLQPIGPGCCTAILQEDTTPTRGSYTDLRAFGLPAPPPRNASRDAKTKSEDELKAAFVSRLPDIQKRVRAYPVDPPPRKKPRRPRW